MAVQTVNVRFWGFRDEMSVSLTIAALWALAATCVALLPMRFQYVPGVALLIAAPFVIGFVG